MRRRRSRGRDAAVVHAAAVRGSPRVLYSEHVIEVWRFVLHL